MTIISPKHPVWLVGFRPFFILAIFTGAFMPFLWWAVFSGKISLAGNLNPLQWHAHEMLFGFGGAILIGFLLTASKNWVGIRGIFGLPLFVLATLWAFERIIIYFLPNPSSIIGHVIFSLFFFASTTYLIWTLYIYRKKDSFIDNFYFYLLLLSALVAKNLLISKEHYALGVTMSVGVFRLAFAVMFERTITQFMKSTEGLQLYRNALLDYSIKSLIALSILQELFPKVLSVLILTFAGILLLIRWCLWHPNRGLLKFGNATMYIGYLGLIVHFFLEALRLSDIAIGVGTISLHTFTFLTMGIVIPSMIVRISQGHTGRKPEFHLLDQVAICCIFVAAIFRLVLISIFPVHFNLWLLLASLSWLCSFILLGYRFIPMLIRPRIDGREH